MTVAEINGDYDLKTGDTVARGVDPLFASVKFYQDNWASGICYDAIKRTAADFHAGYPGWDIYRLTRHGDERSKKAVVEYGEVMAAGVAKAQKLNGRPVVAPLTRQKFGWIRQAGRDGVDYLIYGKFPAGLNDRAKMFGVGWETYQKVRDSVAGGLWVGAETWRDRLHMHFFDLAKREYSRGGLTD